MNRRTFFCSLLGLAAVAALPSAQAEAAPLPLSPDVDADVADLPAEESQDSQYFYRRRRYVVRRRVFVRRRVVVRRRFAVRRAYYRPVYVRRRRPRVFVAF